MNRRLPCGARLGMPAGLCALALITPHTPAQGIDVSAGSSSLLGVDGLTVTQYMGNRASVLSVGRNAGGFIMGGATEFHRPNGVTRYGDTALAFVLPTDLDGAGRSVGARGVDWTATSGSGSVQFFAGQTGNPLGFGYLRSVDPQRWGSSLSWSRAIASKLSVGSLTAFGAAHAALAWAKYVFRPNTEVAATTGWSGGHPVLAVSTRLSGASWSVRASQTFGQLQLRPETAVAGTLDQAHIPERAGFNLDASRQLTPWVLANVERVQYGRDLAAGLPDGAVLHEAGLTARSGAWVAGARAYSSHDGPNRAEGLAGLTSWTYGSWRLEASIAESRRAGSPFNRSILAEATRDVSGTVRLTAGANVEGSQPDLVFGAEVHAGWGSAQASERMVYVPFGPTAGFTRVTDVSLRLHPRGVETSMETLVGKGVPWMYSVVGETFVGTPGVSQSGAALRPRRASLAKYVVKGRVVEESGLPVAAAAVRIDDSTTVWTDSDGYWESRQNRSGIVHLQLAAGESLDGSRYVMVDEPQVVSYATDEGAVVPVTFTVRRCGGSCGAPVVAPLSVSPAIHDSETEAAPQTGFRDGDPDLVELVRRSAPALWRIASQ